MGLPARKGTRPYHNLVPRAYWDDKRPLGTRLGLTNDDDDDDDQMKLKLGILHLRW